MATDNAITDSTWNKFTQGLTTIRSANSSFDTELTATIQKLNTLNNTKFVLNIEMNQAQKELEKTKLALHSVSNAENKAAMQTASINYDNLIKNLGYVTDKTKSVEKGMNGMVTAARKTDNQIGSMSASGLLKGLATSDLGQMAINTGLNVATTRVGSAFGSDAGTMFSSTASSAISGAMAGVGFGPIGMAVGGLAGAAIGAINAQNAIQEQKDSVFKSVVQDSYNNVKKAQDDTLSSGTTIAASREQVQLSFSKSLGGNDVAAKSLESEVSGFAAKTPIPYDQLASLSKTLLSKGYGQDEIIPMLSKLGDTAAALEMSGDGINSVAIALGDLKTIGKGKVSAAAVNSLQSSGINVTKYLSGSLNKTDEQIKDMILKGQLSGEQVENIVSASMSKNYSGNMSKEAQTYDGLQTLLKNSQDALNSSMGEGYNQERKPELQNQINELNGENGTKMKDAYKMIGEWEGSLQNTHDSSVRNAMNATMNSDEYKNAAAQNNRVEMGKLLAEAKVKGENEYKASEGYQLQVQSDLDLATRIRNDTGLNKNYWETGYQMAQQFSTGLDAAMLANKPVIVSAYVQNNSTGVKTTVSTGYIGMQSNTNAVQPDTENNTGYGPNQKMSGAATGIFRVPYNNFPALLHEGETVSTAAEARSAKNYPNVTITGNSFVVREEADIDKIARAFVEKLTKISAVAIAS